jgi:hypothetical protein
VSDELERRYRQVLRLLPGWYRDQWEDDMVAAFLDSWLTGDPETDAYIMEVAGPELAETASVAGLAARLYLTSVTGPAARLYRIAAGSLRRHLTWAQAVRSAVLAVVLLHAVQGLSTLVFVAWVRHWIGWLPRPPASLVPASPPGVWVMGGYVVAYAWIVVFLMLVLRYYRTGRIIATLIVVSDLAWLLHHVLGGTLLAAPGEWAYWALLDLAPLLAMAAFHQDAPPAPRGPWLLALPANYLLVPLPLLVLQVTGNGAWVPDFPGLCCLVVSLLCLAQAPRAWSRRSAGSGAWSLTLMLLAVVAAAFRIVSIGDYLQDRHMIAVSVAELLILAAASALVAPDAARTGTATPAPRPRTQAIAV